MGSADEFEKTLDADPTDVACRMAYADWLDEHGNSQLAAAQRWMALKGKRPTPWPAGRSPKDAITWNWWLFGCSADQVISGCTLPKRVWMFMPKNDSTEGAKLSRPLARGSTLYEYNTRQEAEAALAVALANLESRK